MNEELTNDEVEIDLVDLGYVLLDKWRYLLISLIAGAVLLGAYSFFFIAPTYESTAKLYVVSASDDSVVNLSDLNLGTSLTADYEQLMLSYPVLNRVIDRLDLDVTSDELAKAFSLNNPSDTRILEITATSTDPQMAMDLAETMAEEAIDYLPDTMSTLAPNLAQHAKLPESKVAPWNYKKIYKICAFKPLAYTSRFYIFLINSILFQKFLAKSRIVKGTLSSTSFSIFIPVISSITRTAFLSTFSNDAFAFTFQSNYQQKYYVSYALQATKRLNILIIIGM